MHDPYMSGSAPSERLAQRKSALRNRVPSRATFSVRGHRLEGACGKNRGQTELSTVRPHISLIPVWWLGTVSSVPRFFTTRCYTPSEPFLSLIRWHPEHCSRP